MSDLPPIWVFLLSCVSAALAGLAALLRTGHPLTKLLVVSSILNSGLLGLGIALIWYAQQKDNTFFLIGVCLLSGLGGMSAVDFILKMFKGGLHINFSEDKKTDQGE